MKKQKQKKILVVAAIALMIALVSGMGAMTYARYISSSKVEDVTATAAKWGFVVNVNTENLFSTDYVKGAGDYATPVADDNGVAVNAAAASLAPGTSGSFTVSVTGQAEVLAKLTLSINVDSNIHLNTHYPIKWTLNDGSSDLIADATIDDLVDKLADLSITIDAGDPAVDLEYTITWEWDFNDADTDVAKTASINDTIIGFKSAGVAYAALGTTYDMNGALYNTHITSEQYADAEYLSTILKFDFTATVEQIQTKA